MDVLLVDMTVEQLLLAKHEEAISETVDKLLSSIAQGGEIRLDANISKIKDLSDSIVMDYKSTCQALFQEVNERQPTVFRQVSIDQAKLERTQRSARAIKEREEKRTELSRKLKSLRKSVAVSVRQQLTQT